MVQLNEFVFSDNYNYIQRFDCAIFSLERYSLNVNDDLGNIFLGEKYYFDVKIENIS